MGLADVTPLGGQRVAGGGLRAARKAKGMTQKALAQAMGVSRSSVARWEKGECLPQRAQRSAMAKALEMDSHQVEVLLRFQVTHDPSRAASAPEPSASGDDAAGDAFWDIVAHALRQGFVQGADWVDVAGKLARHHGVKEWMQ